MSTNGHEVRHVFYPARPKSGLRRDIRLRLALSRAGRQSWGSVSTSLCDWLVRAGGTISRARHTSAVGYTTLKARRKSAKAIRPFPQGFVTYDGQRSIKRKKFPHELEFDLVLGNYYQVLEWIRSGRSTPQSSRQSWRIS